MILPTTITGSYPRPHWFDRSLAGRSFKSALGDSLFREQYLDAVASIIVEQEAAGLDIGDIMTAELGDVAAAGCPLIKVEEPPHHMRAQQPECTDADLDFLTEAFNRQLTGVNAEIWVHTCWGNPNQQRVHWEVPSYESSQCTRC